MTATDGPAIAAVCEDDLGDLLPLMRAYCDFYEVAPSDDELLSLSRALIADPEHEGVQLLARDEGRAVGFATIFWSWATTSAERIGVMNDLFVAILRCASAGSYSLRSAMRRAALRCAEHRSGHRSAPWRGQSADQNGAGCGW